MQQREGRINAMTNSIMTDKIAAKSDVVFDQQYDGYNKEQVDRYIANLAAAYQKVYDEYNGMCSTYNGLVNDLKSLQLQEQQSRHNTDAIGKALVEAEALAQKIIADARSEAVNIIVNARAEAQRVVDSTNTTAKLQADKIIEDANASALQTRVKAKMKLNQTNDAIAEALRKLNDQMQSISGV